MVESCGLALLQALGPGTVEPKKRTRLPQQMARTGQALTHPHFFDQGVV